MAKVVIDPVTRIEGHLSIELEVDKGKVLDAKSSGDLFRGWETILQGRDPRDAQHITQRICGVCPVGHAMASTLNLDNAFKISPPDNGRIIRNLIAAGNLFHSHILHFYHLAALDFVDITSVVRYKGKDPALNNLKEWAKKELENNKIAPAAPFLPRYEGDYIKDDELNLTAISHYVEALGMARKGQEMIAIWGGKMPHVMTIVPGGVTEQPTAEKIAAYVYRLEEIQSFINNKYIPDVIAVAKAYPKYFKVGKGCGNLLSYGVFEKNNEATDWIHARGVFINGKADKLDPNKIIEHVKYSKYSSATKLHPSKGETVPKVDKEGAYSWLKAPRYDNNVMEVGPLARMGITYLTKKDPEAAKLVESTLKMFDAPVDALFSVLGRHAARALEAKFIADKAASWALELKPGKPVATKFEIPENGEGFGLTEAQRGSLGHWISVKNKKIDRYQCIVPSTWNCSPMDDSGKKGAIEQALIGTEIKDTNNPIEAARIVRSFDPCIACAVHIVEPAKGVDIKKFKIV